MRDVAQLAGWIYEPLGLTTGYDHMQRNWRNSWSSTTWWFQGQSKVLKTKKNEDVSWGKEREENYIVNRSCPWESKTSKNFTIKYIQKLSFYFQLDSSSVSRLALWLHGIWLIPNQFSWQPTEWHYIAHYRRNVQARDMICVGTKPHELVLAKRAKPQQLWQIQIRPA